MMPTPWTQGPGLDPATLRERIEAESREAERLRVTADQLNRRIWEEMRATEDHVKHIRWLRDDWQGGDDDDR